MNRKVPNKSVHWPAARSMLNLCLFISGLPLHAVASDYSWLETKWVSEEGQRIIFSDGFITTFSCMEYRQPYFIRPIDDARFELIFDHAISYDFIAERKDEALCITLPRIWDDETQTWFESGGICYKRDTRDSD